MSVTYTLGIESLNSNGQQLDQYQQNNPLSSQNVEHKKRHHVALIGNQGLFVEAC